MIKVLYIFRRNRTEKLELFRRGQGPDEMLYGINYLDKKRFLVDYVEGDTGYPHPMGKVVKRLEQLIVKKIGGGFAFDIVLENWQRLKTADVILSTVDTCGLPITLFKKLGFIKAKMIYISQGLSDNLDRLPARSFWRWFYTGFYSSLLKVPELILVLGVGAASHLSRMTGIDLTHIKVVPFGIDQDFWHPAESVIDGDFVLSVGSDKRRDYQTLIQAIGNRPLKIVTRLPLPKEIIPPNVEVRSDYSDIELRSLYQQARYIVIPQRDENMPSGQSVALQAMACGKAVILTRTRGLWEPEFLRHLENVFLVEPEDVHNLSAALAYCDEHPDVLKKMGNKARELIVRRYTSKDFAYSIQKVIEAVLPQAYSDC